MKAFRPLPRNYVDLTSGVQYWKYEKISNDGEEERYCQHYFRLTESGDSVANAIAVYSMGEIIAYGFIIGQDKRLPTIVISDHDPDYLDKLKDELDSFAPDRIIILDIAETEDSAYRKTTKESLFIV
jgi:hypothetical protein